MGNLSPDSRRLTSALRAYARPALTPGLAVLVCVVAAAVSSHGSERSDVKRTRRDTAPLRANRVLFARAHDQSGRGFDILVLTPASGKTEHLCSLFNTWLGSPVGVPSPISSGPVPDAVGMLPSPSGGWVLVWGGLDREWSIGSAFTDWVAIRPLDKKRLPLARTPVYAAQGVAAFPHWVDEHTVVLEVPGKTLRWNLAVIGAAGVVRSKPESLVGAGKPITDLGHQIVRWFRAYYEPQWQDCRSAVNTLMRARAIKWGKYAAVRREWACILNLGVPAPYGVRNPNPHGHVPRLAVSPDHTRVARADQGVERLMRHQHPLFQERVNGSRLEVFALPSGRRLFGIPGIPGTHDLIIDEPA